ncbi:hypothetical protein CK203_048378 [Vitis vinifera]|uniref:Uncharacterized protein n=1 Tax=Vitis vinifera TaxID=29760 RepID=A0A438HRI1_VITVI|nr:hypothetical protein CK203_048378 [Vitis vinifera]
MLTLVNSKGRMMVLNMLPFWTWCSKNPKKEVFEPVSKDMLTYDCKALDSLEWCTGKGQGWQVPKLEKLQNRISLQNLRWMLLNWYFGSANKVLDRGERIELLVDKTENLQFQVCAVYFCYGCGQFPEAGKATAAKDVAPEPPLEADGGRNRPCPNHNTVAYSL